MRIFWLILMFTWLVVCGCTTSIKHLSDPRVEDDGYTMPCQGFEVGDQWEISGDACYNIEKNHGFFIFFEGKYHWRKR